MKPSVLKVRCGSETFTKPDGTTGSGGKGALVEEDVTFTLGAVQDMTLVDGNYQVRRLTPIECERLQGFPDDYTKVPYRGKSAEDCPDAPRYKALGNSFAVPVVKWIGERMEQVDGMLNDGDVHHT